MHPSTAEWIFAGHYLPWVAPSFSRTLRKDGPHKQPGSAQGTTVAPATQKPRVYLQSESKGVGHGSLRDQSMEMAKDFEKNCPDVRVTVKEDAADYVVHLSHIEHGFVRDNQFQVANKDGDLISQTKEGGSISGGVKKACALILADWQRNPQGEPAHN
jgi:hypothetical protein